MRGFVELTNGSTKVLLPVGSFETWGFENGDVRIYNVHDEDTNFLCKESYDEVKALIAAALEPEPEKRFIKITHVNGASILLDISRIYTVYEAENETVTRIYDADGDHKEDFWIVKESAEEIHRRIMEAQEG